MNSQIPQVLVVDDNEAEQYLIEYLIHSHNKDIKVLKAFDGREALNTISTMEQENSPSFILLDINMPGMNGFEFLEHYHRTNNINSDVIVMLTVSLVGDDYKKCMQYSRVKKTVAKPLSTETIATFFPGSE